MKFDPTATCEFERKAAFFLAFAKSNGRGALTKAIVTNAVAKGDRPAARAARIVAVRGGGKFVREFVAKEKEEFFTPFVPKF